MRVFDTIAPALRGRIALLGLSGLGLAGCLDLNPNVKTCSVTIAPATITVPVNGRVPIVGTAFDCDGNSIKNEKISYTTGNSAIATVSVDGSVIGIAPGQTTVSAVADDKSGTAQVTVTPELAAQVAVNPAAVTLRETNTRPFSVTLRNAAGTIITGRPVRWTSSNSGVASVDQNGIVTANSVGNAVIQAEADQATATSNVIVTKIPILACSLAPQTQKITVGASTQPTLTIRDSTDRILTLEGRSITWTSNNEIVAGVTQSGVVTARKAGTATIRAVSSENPSVGCNFTLEAVDPRIATVTVVPRNGVLRLGVARQFNAALLDSVNNAIVGKSAVWSTNTPTVIQVSPIGVVTGISLGTGRIIATAEGVADTVTFQVTRIPVGSVVTTPIQATTTQGGVVNLTATVKDSAGTVVTDRTIEWIISDPTKATITQNGLNATVTTFAPGAIAVQAISESIVGQSNINILPTPVDSVAAPATFTVIRGQTSGFTVTPRDANGVPLVGRNLLVISDKPNIAAVPQVVNTTTVQVAGISVGEAELTIQALDVNGAPQGKVSRVKVTVVLPPTQGGNLTTAPAISGSVRMTGKN